MLDFFRRSLTKIMAALLFSIAPLTSWAAVCNPGDIASCQTTNGCLGTKECYGAGYWAQCEPLPGKGAKACTGCGGATGKVVCDDAGVVVACWVSDIEICNNCDDNGDGYIDNIPGKTSNTLAQSCNPSQCSQGGSQVCTNGVWGACGGCGGDAPCTTACNSTGRIACNASCAPVSSVCVAAEVCNNCDDNGNSTVDEGLTCMPCGL